MKLSDAQNNSLCHFLSTGEIHIAHFQEKKAPLTEGLNALILGAVADINEGVTRNLTDQNPVLPGNY